MTELKNRYEFVLLYDVENGNPNGDPDAGNLPRVDVETNYGIVTDVCLKRKIRNYVEMFKGRDDGFEIYIREGAALKTKQESKTKEAMCKAYYDIRTFGAVMPQLQKTNDGQVRGPVQISFSKSIEPIFPNTITITRLVDEKEDNKPTMGNKHIVPYALYRMEGYISAKLAQQTGFSEEDLELFWEALENMFEHDHSAARGKMAVRKLIIFKHASELGNAHSHKLFESVRVERKDSCVDTPARSFNNYQVTIARENTPQNVEVIERVE
jgi:CRISPR-associated protein Csd2